MLGKRDILLGLRDLDDVLPLPHWGPSADFCSAFQRSQAGVMGLIVALAADRVHPALPDTVALSVY